MGKNFSYPPELRAQMSATMKQVAADPEWRKRNSETRKGKPSRGGHVTMHVQRGVVNPNCIFCQQERDGGGSDA
ncbi:hypothetical protein [Arthrobacter pigmenti]